MAKTLGDGVFEAEPLDAVVFFGRAIRWLAFPGADCPEGQVEIAGHDAQVGGLWEQRDLHDDAELFEELPAERRQRGFAWLDMAAREVPHGRVRGTLRGPEAEQDVVAAQEGSDGYLGHTTTVVGLDRRGTALTRSGSRLQNELHPRGLRCLKADPLVEA